MSMTKFQTAIREPEKVQKYIYKKYQNILRKMYPIYIKTIHDGTIQKSIQGSQMELDVQDEGIARDLASWGIREPHTTRAYKNALKRLDQDIDDNITIVDIGANIGYYAFMPLTILDDAHVIAIEADDQNIRSLRKNIGLNDYSDRISVVNCAVGSEQTITKFHQSTHSNRHSMQTEFKEQNPEFVSDTVDIKVKSLDDIISEIDIDHSDIDVIRMDVEGYEANIFKGMDRVLSSSDSILFQIEIHPNLLSDEELDYIFEILDEREIELLSVARGRDAPSIDSLTEIRDWSFAEILVKWHNSTD